jgi:pyruvate dehydrogenase E2 component (dihydrolipoamide acetyltransferase)
MIPVRMPQVGENLTTGVVLEWCKSEGDDVARGEVVAIVESEKAAFEVTAESAGLLLRIDCHAEQQAQVLEPIAWIGAPGEVVPEVSGPEAIRSASGASEIAPMAARPLAGSAGRPRAGGVTAAALPSKGSFASPSARRLARQLLVDLTRVRGSGPSGRILRRDVLAAALADCGGAAPGSAHPAAAIEPVIAGGDRVVPHSRLRSAIAERMAISARSVPHFYLFADIDVTDAQALRATLGEPTISLTDFVIAAVTRSLRAHERLNAHVGTGSTVLKAGCHIGFAVAVDEGVLVPALTDADRLGLAELAVRRRQVTSAARSGVVTPGSTPTFTITSLASYGVERFLPLINPPECAILAVGRSSERVIARDGATVVREQMTLCLACDHRAVDGAGAAAFLQTLTAWLEEPARLVADCREAP